MCYHCWVDNGKDWDPLNKKVVECARLIDIVEDQQTLGLHIIIDDWNIDDESVESTQSWDLTEDERNAANFMMQMTEDERSAALALSHVHQGHFKRPYIWTEPPE